MQKFMYKNVPMWVLLLALLLGALFLVAFGWAVKKATEGSYRAGLFGEAAYAVSSFPTFTYHTITGWITDITGPEQFFHVPRYGLGLDGFTPVKARPGLEVAGLLVKADKSALDRAAGWRILVGSFDIGGNVDYAALAVSPDLEITHIWHLSEEPVGTSGPKPAHRKYLNGFAILPDDSVIYVFDGGVSLQRRDICSNLIWSREGYFHHSVSLGGNGGQVWALRDDERMVELDNGTGETIREISLTDVIKANPETDILRLRQKDINDISHNRKHTEGIWLADRFHINDAEPLPELFAGSYDGFNAGDLLVSLRSLNLIFILDPDDLKIKWWRVGITHRQHDPDWGPDGTITVYDNRLGLDYSRIVRMKPGTLEAQVILDGRKIDFYSRVRGKHELTQAGNLLVASTQQGRIFETDPNGNIVVEFQNTVPDTPDTNYLMSEALWLPPETFDFIKKQPCPK